VTAQSGAVEAEREQVDGRRLLPKLAMLDRPLTSYHLIIGTTGLLLAIGLVMVLSTSSASQLSVGGSPYSVFAKQLAGALVGLPMIWALSRTPPRLLRSLAKPMFVLAICGLILVLVGFGRTTNGAERWISVAGIQIQPSEFAKLALLIWAADLLARKDELKQLNDWRALLVPLLPGSALLALLVMLGDDLGTTFVLLVILMTLLWVIGTPGRLYVCMLGLVLFALLALIVVKSYRANRLTEFLNQSGNPVGTNMQPIQGKYAIGSGGLFGVGLGESMQKWGWVPNASSDFIFAILGEELGLIGTSIVVFLYGGLAYAGLRVARRMTTPFMRLAAAGITVWIVVQALVNICAVIGLVPITGVPLPLVSQGLSSLLVTMAAIGVLLSLARREPGAREALAAGGPSLAVRLVRSLRPSPRRPPAPSPRASKVRRISGQVRTRPPARPVSPRLADRGGSRSRPSASQRWPKGGGPL
jgi:cell division protein FtsW